MRLYYTLTTIDPVILSQDNSTTNNHQCLDYIPGNVILGLLAAEHYNNISADLSWQAFHSGDCIFSPCYPLFENTLCYPTPASWHYIKNESGIHNHIYNKAVISNHAASGFERAETTQYKQYRDGFVSPSGNAITVKQGITTKTAIDRITGTAQNAKLFSFSYLQEKQTFAGWIDTDNEALLTLFKNSLNKIHRIGRSRNNEFGRIKLELCEATEQADINNSSNTLTLWCLSDCEILDELGLPTACPTGEAIHPNLSSVTLNISKSFIRSHKVSRFNQKRQGVDSEQFLISKGSILVYDLPSTIEQQTLNQIANKGIGINKQQGLGWVSINPIWSATKTLPEQALFTAPSFNIATNTNEESNLEFTSTLLTWLHEKAQNVQLKEKNDKVVTQKLQAIVKLYQHARSYNNIINSHEAGPSATQWGHIKEAVRNTNSEQWRNIVFAGNNAICKANNDELGWGIQWQQGTKLTTFAEQTEKLLSPLSVETMRLFVERLYQLDDLSTYKDLKKAKEKYLTSLPVTEGANS